MHHAPSAPRLFLLLAAAALAACDSGAEPLRPGAFEVLAPEARTATVGSAVATPPAVRVITTDGRAVSGIAVTFTVTGGGGELVGGQAVSDASGVARAASWTLGTQAGPNTVSVTSPRIPNTEAVITATGVADVPAALGVETQPSTLAASGSPLQAQPVVRLHDRFGNPTAGAGVSVSAAVQGAIILAGDTAITDASGAARFSGLTLTGAAGSYLLRFAAPGLAQTTAAVSTVLAGGVAHHLEVGVQPPTTAFRGVRLHPAPVVRVVDLHGNSATTGPVLVSAALEGSGSSLTGTTSVTAQDGTAVFSDVIIPDTGAYRLRFAAAGLGEVLSDSVRVVPPGALTCALAGRDRVTLAFALGETVWHRASASAAPSCLEFSADAAAGHQYLVLFENMPVRGDTALFPGSGPAPGFSFSLESQPTAPAATLPALRAFPNALAAARPAHQWDFGDGPIYEGRVEAPPAGVPAPRLLRAGVSIPLSSVTAQPAVGDTIEVYLAGIARLSVPAGTQRAVVRRISDHLIIAEDVRLPTLERAEGGTNRFLETVELDSIVEQYALFARVQGDMLFEGRHNSAVESWGTPARVLAVHTLMYADNVWGYTWPNLHYFAFDYWVGSTNGITKSYSQNATRVADNLFMHEIAHLRHFGLSERSGVSTAARGNTWLVEGFARATERLPIAMRLLGTATPSRLDNVVLPRNTAAFGNAYFADDVPTYLQAGARMFSGYNASSFIFDYFADQVALRGGDPLAALRDFVVYGGDENTLNQVIANRLGEPVTFPELFTRARIALYADDYGVGLPAWTQYLQYQLRASRPPANSASDPRNAWLKLSPGVPEVVSTVALPLGTARGVLIDGTVAGAADARILIDASSVPNGVISITRVR